MNFFPIHLIENSYHVASRLKNSHVLLIEVDPTIAFNYLLIFYLPLTVLFSLQEENKCHPNPCRNGGICTEANGGFICTCMEGYKGTNCEGM